MEATNIRFTGFTPSTFTKSYFQWLVEKLHEEFPQSAVVNLRVRRIREDIVGVITINAHRAHFFAVAHANGVVALGEKLLERLRRQSDRWQTKRRHQKKSHNRKPDQTQDPADLEFTG